MIGFEEEVKEILKEQEILHADESGANVSAKTYWFHVLAAGVWILFNDHKKRGQEGMKEIGVLPNYKGVLVHDCWAPYWKAAPECKHRLCGAHVCRELYALEEKGEEWAGELENLLYEANQEKGKNGGKLSEEQKEYYEEKFREIREKGREKHPPAIKDPQKKGRPKQSKAQNLLDRLEKHERGWLGFIKEDEVPFTNNEAERPIRMLKLQVKMSGGFRTEEGLKRFARIRSFIGCSQKHGNNILENLRRSIQEPVEDVEHFFGQPQLES